MALRCPRCSHSLRSVTLRKADLDHCAHCGGTWFDPGEEEAAVSPLISPKVWENASFTKELGPSKLISPLSKHPMVAYQLKEGGEEVVVDRCQQTGGLWLDAGEARKLLDMMQGSERTPEYVAKASRFGVVSYLFQLVSIMPIEVWNPRHRKPFVTWGLFATIVVAFVIQQSAIQTQGVGAVLAAFALQPKVLDHGPMLGFITYIFMHADIMHMLGNLYFLYIFGDNVEDTLGRFQMIVLFLVTGIFAGLSQVLFQGSNALPLIGASGAVAGLMGSYMVLFPRAKVRLVLIVPVYVSVVWYFGLWILMQFALMFQGSVTVGWIAHLGGFVAGVLLTMPFRFKSMQQSLRAQVTTAPPA